MQEEECTEMEVAEGICFWPGFMQSELKLDPAQIFDELCQIPEQPVIEDNDITCRKDGKPRIITGKHKDLNMRGKPIRRDKIWAQTTPIEEGYLAYRYTGWQNGIANAAVHISHVPAMQRVLEGLNKVHEQQYNHAIFTRYKDGKDCIGPHHDKMRDIDPESWIAVLKIGDVARKFALYDKDTDNNKVVWCKRLSPGTAVFMNAAGNASVKHGVPEEDGDVGPSGSIVMRRIKTVLPWAVIDKKSEATRRKRRRLLLCDDES
jgi:hypothetical protein